MRDSVSNHLWFGLRSERRSKISLPFSGVQLHAPLGIHPNTLKGDPHREQRSLRGVIVESPSPGRTVGRAGVSLFDEAKLFMLRWPWNNNHIRPFSKNPFDARDIRLDLLPLLKVAEVAPLKPEIC